MYSTCIFCHSALGHNEIVEHFPVGRRLAFDGEKGRLWAVCGACGRWNLSPLEERWEAIEECERRFRDTSLRTSTENIGLARLRDGTELVRIGRPLRPEFAAWRYGTQFGGRLRRGWWSAVSLGGVVAGVGAGMLLGPAGLLAGVPIVAAAEAMKARLPKGSGWLEMMGARRTLVDDRGDGLLADGRSLQRVRLRRGLGERDGLVLDVRTSLMQLDDHGFGYHTPTDHVLSGARALRAASVFLARANAGGAPGWQVQQAVRRIERAGSPERYFGRAEEEARRTGAGYRDIWDLPLQIRMALEMAAHEDAERRALHGELAELERAWREAEDVAAIADALPVMPQVEEKLDKLRAARAAGARRLAERSRRPPE